MSDNLGQWLDVLLVVRISASDIGLCRRAILVKEYPPAAASGSSTLDEISSRPQAGLLYHYTSAKSLADIGYGVDIDGNVDTQLFATHLGYLNDTGERKYGIEVFVSCIDEALQESPSAQEEAHLASLKAEISKDHLRYQDVFVTSFAAGLSLPMFRMYCPPEDGYAIGIEFESLKAVAAKQKFSLRGCVYDLEAQRKICREFISSKKPTHDDVLDLILHHLPLLKHPSFKDEDEWRAMRQITTRSPSSRIRRQMDPFKFRAGIRGVTPYIPLSIAEAKIEKIVLAPSGISKEAREHAVQMLFQRFRWPMPVCLYESGYQGR